MKDITIYYIDDDSEDRELFQYAVNAIPQKIILRSYESGDRFFTDAKETSAPTENALVFLDINLPIKSGFDILGQIRRTEELKKLPVVMYSTSNNPNSVQTSKLMGANLYTVKPGSINELKNIIEKVIQIDWLQFDPEKQEYILY